MSYDYKKQNCLGEQQVDGLEKLGDMGGPGAAGVKGSFDEREQRARELKAKMAKYLGQGSSILCTDESLIDDNDSFEEMVKGIQNMSLDSPAKQPSIVLKVKHGDGPGFAGGKAGNRGTRTAANTREGGARGRAGGNDASAPELTHHHSIIRDTNQMTAGGDSTKGYQGDQPGLQSPARAFNEVDFADDNSATPSDNIDATQSDFTQTMKNGKFFKEASKKVQQKKLVGEISDDLIEKLKQIKKKRMFMNQRSKVYLSDNFPVFAFFAQCIQQHQLDIPIFEKMKDSTLEIKNQKLSLGHCEAIKEGFRVIKESLRTSDDNKN